MPIIKSAKKRVRVTARATERNRVTKDKLKSAVKAFAKALSGKSAGRELSTAQSALAQAGKKNIMHKNKVARKQRQLASAAKKAGVTTVGSGKAKVAKATPRKAVAKKAPAKKTAVKTAAKKPTVKKK